MPLPNSAPFIPRETSIATGSSVSIRISAGQCPVAWAVIPKWPHPNHRAIPFNLKRSKVKARVSPRSWPKFRTAERTVCADGTPEE